VRPATKPEPDNVTTVPPDTDPDDGDTDVTEPADTYSTCTPLRLTSPPLLIDTSTTRMPAPRAGITQLAADEEDTTADRYDHAEPSTDDPPTAQCTPRTAESPMPDKDTTLPGTTAIGDADVTFMTPTRVSDTPLPAVNSWPFDDTSTVVLPDTPATDTHSTTPLELTVDDTITAPIWHQAMLPAAMPSTDSDTTVPPSTEP
jgi:hypothetical protein